MANIYFNVEDEENLIELVHNYPALYDSQNANYKNFSSKAFAWKEIGEKMKKTENACKAKWKHIRDWYIRKRKTGKLPTGSGTFSSHLRSRFDKLRFVINSDKTMEIYNFSEAIKKEQTMPQKDDPKLTTEGSESNLPVTELIKAPQSLKLRIPKRKLRTNLQQIIPSHMKRRSEEKRGEMKRRRIQERDETEMTQCVSLATLKHPIDEFFGAMASIVKQLPVNIQVQVKQEVSRIILRAESRVVSCQKTSSQLSDNSNISSSSCGSSKEDGTMGNIYNVESIYTTEKC